MKHSVIHLSCIDIHHDIYSCSSSICSTASNSSASHSCSSSSASNVIVVHGHGVLGKMAATGGVFCLCTDIRHVSDSVVVAVVVINNYRTDICHDVCSCGSNCSTAISTASSCRSSVVVISGVL